MKTLDHTNVRTSILVKNKIPLALEIVSLHSLDTTDMHVQKTCTRYIEQDMSK